MPRYRRQSPRQTIGPAEEVLGSGGAFSRLRLGGAGGPHRPEELSACFGGERRLDRHQTHDGLAVPGQNDLFSSFGAVINSVSRPLVLVTAARIVSPAPER